MSRNGNHARLSARWHVVQFTPDEAERFDRRVHNVADSATPGWRPYIYRVTRGAISQRACHTDAEFRALLDELGLRVVGWGFWEDGARSSWLERRQP